jgi:hypothetical protein
MVATPHQEIREEGARRCRGTAQSAIAGPRSVLKIWRTRGGGFYGFGYVVAFVVLEVRAFVGNFEGDGDIATMIVQEVLQFVFRFAAQSFVNGFMRSGGRCSCSTISAVGGCWRWVPDGSRLYLAP